MEKLNDNHRPTILVTNDDGVKAKGIEALIEAVRPFGNVVVVAPYGAMSGMSHAITVKEPLFLTKVREEEGLVVYATNGTPADCIKLAFNQVLTKKPDFVVSGINHGTNSSVSVHYSGTVGGAREAALYGVPAIGFSLLDNDHNADFTQSIEKSRTIFEYFLTKGLKEGVYLNVNIPVGDNVKGIKVCRQAKGGWIEEFEARKDPRGNNYFWLTGRFHNEEPKSVDTDEWALSQGYVSVVPCTIDLTHNEFLSELSDSELNSQSVFENKENHR